MIVIIKTIGTQLAMLSSVTINMKLIEKKNILSVDKK